MKRLLPVLALICSPIFAFCQDVNGVWKGTMYNDSTGQSLDYEIVISNKNGKLSGFTHTSYKENNITYYGVKKINVRVAKDGKIVLQDAKLMENNYPGGPNKNVIQLDVLTLTRSGDDSFLDGIFVTNRSKEFQAFSGRMTVKKVSALEAQTALLKYANVNTEEAGMTASK